MFTNYYKLLNISSDATEEDIGAAIRQSTLSDSLVKEIKMILQNKSLKTIYDEELNLYEASELKPNYHIRNPILEREIKKVKAYTSNIAYESDRIEEKAKKSNNFWLWVFIVLVTSSLGKCISSYYKGKALERNRQMYIHGENSNYSANNPIIEIPKYFKPILKILYDKKTGVMMFCFITVGIISCISNKTSGNKLVEDAISSLRKELPIHMEGFGKVRAIDNNGDTVFFHMKIQDDVSSGLNVAKITNNQTLAKEIVSAQIGMMNRHTIEYIQIIAKQSFGLKILISGNSSKEVGEVFLSPKEIENALQNTQDMSSEDFSLEMVAKTTRLMLPAKVDEVTTWVNTRLTETSFEYVYNIDDRGINLTNTDMGTIKSEKLSMLSQNIDAMRIVVKCCISTNRNLVIKYIGDYSNKTINIVLTPSDLDNIISKQ